MDSEDKAFEEWISRCVLEETAEMIKDMERDPKLDKFVASQELYERILKKAHKRGLLVEEDDED
ncbi:hypothetical protein AALH30_02330 [Blautia pseudococcoides]|uniref:hypothetical protein n=1 Tax=Blautia pseudococcoides TaxID=1796616 RepID=UPI00148AF531|nr:hypothetical protein [Blautia pseudococcoides]QJU14750.1 hypothetical protein HL650_09945 [Blautia pseudococcoides]